MDDVFGMDVGTAKCNLKQKTERHIRCRQQHRGDIMNPWQTASAADHVQESSTVAVLLDEDQLPVLKPSGQW